MMRRSFVVVCVILVHSYLQCLAGSESCDVELSNRFDCDPDASASQADCLERGCCWRPAAPSTRTAQLNTPYCYFPPDFGGYEVTSKNETAAGWELLLRLKGRGSHYGDNIATLKVSVVMETQHRVHVKIIDAAHKRYEVPIPTPTVTKAAHIQDYDVYFTDFPFGFAVVRKLTGAVLFNSSVSAMLYANQFLQISTSLPTANVYGLGEHVLDFRLKTDWNKLTLFARDVATPVGGVNLYGVHPFYLNIEDGGLANGVLLLNSNAMDVILQPTPAVTYRTIGGVMDFYVFTGPSPSDVAKEYQQLIGYSTMPPYWSLGFHLCRWGYNSESNMKEVVGRMKQSGIPQDVQWNDIDYMDKHLDFTLDKKNFGDLPAFIDKIHKDGLHYVMILDPGISNSQSQGSYKPYTDGVDKDVFVKDSLGKPLVGKVWPGTTVFPDFFHPNASSYWTEQLADFHTVLPFDGVWIDMNEPSNFVEGSTSDCPRSSLETPPYTPAVLGGLLMDKTICMTAQQHVSAHYNVHSMYGYSEGLHTMSALEKIRRRRSLVIGRSTFVGSGAHQGHWLGDNHSTWADMAYSIAGILNFNLFGIPLVGADICGFMGDTTEELCARWMQLGAFYPFSRNHNTIGARDQDPAAFGDLLKTASRNALLHRYLLLPYLYTLFYEAHTSGTPVVQPLFFIDPTDAIALKVDKQFMWGASLLISPVLEEAAQSVQAYFPKGVWFDFHSGNNLTGGAYHELPASFKAVNLYVRGGSVLPMQHPLLTTTASRMNGFGLFVAPDETGVASGQLYLDDGESLDFQSSSRHSMINFELKQNVLISHAPVRGHVPHGSLDYIDVYGIQKGPSVVLVNGKPSTNFQYISAFKKLSLWSINLSILEDCKVSWD